MKIRTIETSSTSVDTQKDQKNTSRNQGKSDNYDSPHKRSVRIECYNCHKRGHSFRNCFTASKDQNEAIQKNLPAIKAKYDAYQNDLNSLLGNTSSTTANH